MSDGTALTDLLRERGAGTIEHPGGTLSAHLDRYGAFLRRLATAWEPLLSPAVRDDARRVLGPAG